MKKPQFRYFAYKFTQAILGADQFGYDFAIPPNKKNKKLTTPLGSCFTLILYILCLLYLVYELYLWLSYSIQPTISQIEQTIKTSKFELNTMKYPNFDFFSENASSESTKKYFIPIAYYYTGLGALPPFSLMNVSYTNYDKNRNFELGITLNPANSAIDHWLQVMIYKCHPDLISADEECASEDEFKSFFYDYQSYFQVGFILEEYDIYSSKVIEVPKNFYTYINDEQTIIQYYFLKTSLYNVDRGLIMPTISQSVTLIDVLQQTQTINSKYHRNKYQYNPQFTCVQQIEIFVNPKQVIQNVVFLKIPEFLASVKAIIQSILALGLAIQFYNYYLVNNYFIQLLKRHARKQGVFDFENMKYDELLDKFYSVVNIKFLFNSIVQHSKLLDPYKKKQNNFEDDSQRQKLDINIMESNQRLLINPSIDKLQKLENGENQMSNFPYPSGCSSPANKNNSNTKNDFIVTNNNMDSDIQSQMINTNVKLISDKLQILEHKQCRIHQKNLSSQHIIEQHLGVNEWELFLGSCLQVDEDSSINQTGGLQQRKMKIKERRKKRKDLLRILDELENSN